MAKYKYPFKRLLKKDWSPVLTREIAVIKLATNIDEKSVRVGINQNNQLVITFNISTIEKAGDQRGFDAKEPIALEYLNIKAVGNKAPSCHGLRKEFPPVPGHLNPTKPGVPVSLCLSRGDIQAVYDQFGIGGVLQRLDDWFRAAKTGALMGEGWDPEPRAYGQEAGKAYIHLPAFQEQALKTQNGKAYSTGIAIGKFIKSQPEAMIFAENFSTLPAQNSPLKAKIVETRRKKANFSVYPWLFFWPKDKAESKSGMVFGSWNTFGDLASGLTQLGLNEQFTSACYALLQSGCTFETQENRYGFLLIIGIWRPEPIISEIFGLSKKKPARKLELKAFLISRPATGSAERYKLLEDDSCVHLLDLHTLPGFELFRHLSDWPKITHATVIGCGSLGGGIVDHLIRCGTENLNLMDFDWFVPHNLARSQVQNGNFVDLFQVARKVFYFEYIANKISLGPDKIKINPIPSNVCTVPFIELSKLAGENGILIDMTADEQARRHLTQWQQAEGGKVLRAEIYHKGRLGVCTIANPQADLFDLNTWLYFLGTKNLKQKNHSIRDWLHSSRRQKEQLEEVLLGFGCSSMTVKMPNYIVQQHATAFMPTIKKALTKGHKSGIGINPLDKDGHPTGWQWFNAPKFISLKGEISEGWKIRISKSAQDKMMKHMIKASPKEAGGYLYGRVDYVLKRITFVEAIDLDCKSTPTEIELPPAGRSKQEREFKAQTGQRLAVVGTWHSHPNGPQNPSPKDDKTFKTHRTGDKRKGEHTSMVIISPRGVFCRMEV